jgi:hypothetical protein
MDDVSKAYGILAECIIRLEAYKAVKYFNEKLTLKATRRRYKGKILKSHSVDILFTLGKPNYKERKAIKKAIKDGKKFPLKDIELKYPPGAKVIWK